MHDAWVDLAMSVRVAFQPIIDLGTGAVVAHDTVVRAQAGSTQSLYEWARQSGQLCATDINLALLVVQTATEYGSALPVQVNLLPASVAAPEAEYELARLAHDVQEAGRHVGEVVVQLTEDTSAAPHGAFLRGIGYLRELGFPVCVADVGEGDAGLWHLGMVRPDQVKLGPTLTTGVAGADVRWPIAAAVARFCTVADIPLTASGIQTPQQFAAVQELGIRHAQGDLLAPSHRRPLTALSHPLPRVVADSGTLDPLSATAPDPGGTVGATTTHRRPGPTVTQFSMPVVTVPVDANADTVHGLLARNPLVSSIVLVDEFERPVGWLDRTRFLFEVAGPFGHALNARRPVTRLAEPVPALPASTPALDALEQVAGRDPQHAYDDFVLISEFRRAVGVVRVADLLRAVADLRVRR